MADLAGTTTDQGQLRLGDVIIFFDDRFPPDPSDNGNLTPVNRVAIVVDKEIALFLGKGLFGKRVEALNFSELHKKANVTFRRSTWAIAGDQIAAYFLKYRKQPAYFEAGVAALYLGNLQPFIEGRLFPVRPKYPSDEEYLCAWRALSDALRPLDLIFTVNVTSGLSRFIARTTHGPWSHVAMYVGEGMISESVTSGIRTVSIEAYKGRQYWVAAYRHMELINNPRTVAQTKAGATETTMRFGKGYNYRGAISYGFKAFLGDHSHNLVPNSMIYQGNLVRIAHA